MQLTIDSMFEIDVFKGARTPYGNSNRTMFWNAPNPTTSFCDYGGDGLCRAKR